MKMTAGGFAIIRLKLGSLSQDAVDNINLIVETCEKYNLSYPQSAYVLATTAWETARTFKPIEEYGKGKNRKYGTWYTWVMDIFTNIQAIVDWFNNLNVGEDIHYSRLYEPINSIRGFAVRNLKFGYKGGTLGVDDIIIKHNELATINAEDISIGGN